MYKHARGLKTDLSPDWPKRKRKHKKKTIKRSTSKPVKQGKGLFALSVREIKQPKKRQKPSNQQSKKLK
jgi:hypothetical protein